MTKQEEQGASHTPPCRHYGICGGCSLQHLSPISYHKFKKNLVHERLGKITPLHEEEMILLPPHSRRRASFKIKKQGKNCQIGYYKQRSHELIDIIMCPLLTPAIITVLPTLKELLALILPPQSSGNVWVLDSETGLDIAIETTAIRKLQLPTIEHLTAFARSHDLAQIRVNDLWSLTFREPLVRFSGHHVSASARGFLQASVASDDALSAVVQSYLPASPIHTALDLFCGRGTFSLLLANSADHVEAVDMDIEALQSLRHPKIKTHQQHLFKSPYTAAQLNKYDVIILDPPRDGASAQCQQIAASECATIIYVSCDVATFARDAQSLLNSGYIFEKLRIVDQFLWSPHVEVVGLFTKSSI